MGITWQDKNFYHILEMGQLGSGWINQKSSTYSIYSVNLREIEGLRLWSQPVKAYRRNKISDSKLFMLDHKHITWSYDFSLSRITSDLAHKFNCSFQAIAITSQIFCCLLSCWEHLYQEHLTKACFSTSCWADKLYQESH